MDEGAKKLNDAAVLPPHAYRRNHALYELVCYVNCLIGCRISGNADGVALFKERAKEFMSDHPPTAEVARYYVAVTDYVG